jgi:hypothetical protein
MARPDGDPESPLNDGPRLPLSRRMLFIAVDRERTLSLTPSRPMCMCQRAV